MTAQLEAPYEPPIYSAGNRPQSTFAFGLPTKVIAYGAGFFAVSFAVLIFVHVVVGLALMGVGALILTPLVIAPNGRTL
ncbi:hypothetical protein NL429_28890, partial [Klebsiella pneumoniae]|nr:hypothetical protein [Klebsiella pneumoniae]